jgi:gamma-glutamylcyclotransferase (GGCT)/AIG2-like uncharacterized protein YtfP
MKLYLGYGANTNVAQMATRCPDAEYVCNVTLKHFQLVFRGVADLRPKRDAQVVCSLWVISPEDEKRLDVFEGFPSIYIKRYITIRIAGQRRRCMMYVMRHREWQEEPPMSYEQTLRTGYADCGMPVAQIDDAIRRASKWREKHGVIEVRSRSSWTKPKANQEECA